MRLTLKVIRTGVRVTAEALAAIILAASVLVVAQGPATSSGGSFLPTIDQVVSGKWTFRNSSPIVLQPTGNAQGTILTTAATSTARTWTLPDATDTAVGLTTAQTLTNKTLTAPITSAGLVSGQGATATLTTAQCGYTVLFDRAAGIIYTLPAPQVGCSYTFLVTTTVTSNNHKIITDAGTTLLLGNTFVGVAAGTGTQFWANGSTHIAFTMNGTTTGGLFDSIVYVYCVDATHWFVDASLEGSGTVATPFATS